MQNPDEQTRAGPVPAAPGLWRRGDGVTSVEFGLLAAFLALAILGAVFGLGGELQTLFKSLTPEMETDAATGPSWSAAPDIVMTDRRLPKYPGHDTLWANPFHTHTLPEDMPTIGGREFTLIGDGNPRMLIAGGDGRVVYGPDNPQFDTANYAASGIAYGSDGFHRILIDTPPENETYRVQMHVEDTVIEYSFTNRPY